MNSSDSAEELVRLSLDGMEVAFKIAGEGAKHIAIMIYTIMKDKQQTKGKTRLTNMLKSGKPLKIFTIKTEDLKKFSQEAKRYGVLYCALAKKINSKIDGMVDIMIREEDASKINRIAERFNFKDVASIEKDYEKDKLEKEAQNAKIKTPEEQFIDEIMPVSKEEKEKQIPSNSTNEAEEKSQLDTDLNTKKNDRKENSKDTNKKSVKEELKKINDEKESKVEDNKENKKEQKIKKEKTKKKGKRYKEPKHLGNKTVYRRRKPKNKGRSK